MCIDIVACIHGGPKKQATSEFSLNRIENLSTRRDFYIKFECKRSSRILSVGIKYSVCDLICVVINYFAWSCAVGKISVHDKIAKDGNERNLYINVHLTDGHGVEITSYEGEMMK